MIGFLAQCLVCSDSLMLISCYWMKLFKNRYYSFITQHLFHIVCFFILFFAPNRILRYYQNHFSKLVKYNDFFICTLWFTNMSKFNNWYHNITLIPVKVENLVCSRGWVCSICSLEIFLDSEKISAQCIFFNILHLLCLNSLEIDSLFKDSLD